MRGVLLEACWIHDSEDLGPKLIAAFPTPAIAPVDLHMIARDLLSLATPCNYEEQLCTAATTGISLGSLASRQQTHRRSAS